MLIIFSISSLALPSTLAHFTDLATLKKGVIALNSRGKVLFSRFHQTLTKLMVYNIKEIL
jgi:hypothetical protein